MASILIVEDNLDSVQPLASFLRKFGHEVTVAPDGKEALSRVLLHMPDVVLLDLALPEMDGPSFLEVIHSYLRLQALPVVVWTGLGDSPMIERARHLKVNAILAKAKASFDDIRKAIEDAVVRHPG